MSAYTKKQNLLNCSVYIKINNILTVNEAKAFIIEHPYRSNSHLYTKVSWDCQKYERYVDWFMIMFSSL